MSPRSYFIKPVYAVLRIAGCIALAVIVVGVPLYVVTVRHHERAETRKTCAFTQRMLVQARPFLKHVVEHPDPCETVRRMRGEAI